jgi:hypothetical protein
MLLIVISIAVSAFSNESTRENLMNPNNLPLAIAGFGMPLFIALTPLLYLWSFKFQYRKTPTMAEARTVIETALGLEFDSFSSTNRVVWGIYEAFCEDKTNFLIMQQGNQCFVPISKHNLSPAQIDKFRELLADHLPQK